MANFGNDPQRGAASAQDSPAPPPAVTGPVWAAGTDAAAPDAVTSSGISPRYYHQVAFTLALAGGLLGVVGAVFEELRAGGLALIAAAPIEEMMKPAGIYILLVKWPYLLRGRAYTAGLTALSGLVFALLEACAYVFLYFPGADSDFVLYRFTAPLFMHTLSSFIVGLGLDRRLVDWANDLAPFPRRTRNTFVVAIGLHVAFNIAAVALELTGVIDFGLHD